MIDIYKKKIEMKFGLLKSKIEKNLLESYSKGEFKTEMKYFKKLVLENKNIGKLFYLYDELNSNKGMNSGIVNDYINECITIYENTINKVKKSQFEVLDYWVGDIQSENLYESIDNLFSTDVLNIENKITSRKFISESLIKQPKQTKEPIQLPISSMVNLANKTINNYIENLNESDKQELIKFLSMDESNMEKDYHVVKEDVLNKLKTINENSDIETSTKIQETISKIQSEKFDKLSYFRLKGLRDSI
jgi:hypothetical protein